MPAPLRLRTLLALTVLVIVATLACGRPGTAPQGGSPEGRTIGRPTEPLPAPLALPAANVDTAAAALAGQIMAGGQNALPALLAALQASGIAVRGPRGDLVVQPADGGQGLAVSAWEARFMAGLMGRDRTLLVPLPALQDVLVRAVPELRGEPVARHILEGLRAHARGPEGPMRGWARLIVELGRQRQVGGAQDLLGPVAPTEVRLDAVQLSLITLRLVGDLEALSARASLPRRDIAAGGGAASRRGGGLGGFLADVGGWLAPRPAHAAEPCAEEPAVVSREKVSASGFDVLKESLREKLGRALRGPFGDRIRKLVRDYNTLALLLAALRIEVAMDPPGPPLVRTRTTGPGEERTITARVSLDPKVLGMEECAKALLRLLGLKFNVGDLASGGIAGVPLTWRLTAGHDVLFLQAGERSETDQDGSDTLAVLGKPQTRNLGANAKRVSKQAAVAVRFDLRPYALLGTTPGPGGPLTPPEVLLDLSYGYEVTYPFEVVDWVVEEWRGTITFTETVEGRHTLESGGSSLRREYTITKHLGVTLGETESEVTEPATGTDRATVRGTVNGEYVMEERTGGSAPSACGRLYTTVHTHSAGSRSASASIQILLHPRSYTIHVDSSGSFEVKGRVTAEQQYCTETGIRTYRRSHNLRQVPEALSLMSPSIPYDFGGDFRQGSPRNVLRHSITTTKTVNLGPAHTATITQRLSWDLERISSGSR